MIKYDRATEVESMDMKPFVYLKNTTKFISIENNKRYHLHQMKITLYLMILSSEANRFETQHLKQ